MKHVRPGDRIEMVGLMPNDPDPIPVGTQGIVLNVNGKWDGPFCQISVKWDIDRSLMLLPNDPYRVVRKRQ